jgi:hypothetical protein
MGNTHTTTTNYKQQQQQQQQQRDGELRKMRIQIRNTNAKQAIKGRQRPSRSSS